MKIENHENHAANERTLLLLQQQVLHECLSDIQKANTRKTSISGEREPEPEEKGRAKLLQAGGLAKDQIMPFLQF